MHWNYQVSLQSLKMNRNLVLVFLWTVLGTAVRFFQMRAQSARARFSLPPSIRFPLGLSILVRLWLMLWAASVWRLFAPQPAQSLSDLFIEPWRRWDTQWYLQIATHGYAADGTAAFFPLYPLLIKAVGIVFGDYYLLASLVISNLAALGSFILLCRISSGLFGDNTARKSVLLMAAFPSAFFLWAGYTESLFLLLVLMVFEQISNKRWALAGVAGALASSTRLPGVLLVLPFTLEMVGQWQNRSASARHLLWVSLVPLGIGLYSVYLFLTFGDALLFVHSGQQWRDIVWPWEPIVLSVRILLSGEMIGANAIHAVVRFADNLFELSNTLIFIALVIFSWFKLPRSFTAYLALILFLPLTTRYNVSEVIPLAAMSRYLVVGFPAFILAARILSHPALFRVVITLSFALQAFLAALFVLWVHVG